jgi:prepilin-type N-terminal cleavage/methylation domain-containing protein
VILREQKRGFSLVEVTVALAIVVFATFALIGMLLVGLQGGSDSKQRFQAATIAESFCTTLRAAPAVDFTASGSLQPNFPLPTLKTSANNFGSTPVALTWDGQKAPSLTDSSARFGLIYSIIAPAQYTPSVTPGVSIVYLDIFWPARALPTAKGTSHFELTTTIALP